MDLNPDELNHRPAPSLVYMPHPMLAAAGRQIHFDAFQAGESIAGYLRRLEIKIGSQPVTLALNGEYIAREEWELTYPAAGDLLTMRAMVHGGGGSDIGRIVAIIAVMVAAWWLGPYVGGFLTTGSWAAAGSGTFAAFLGTAIVSIGGTLLINALLPPPRPSNIDGRLGSSSPTFALSGGTNRARPFEPMTVVMGKHRVFPDYGAKFYTEFVGDDQYLNQVFHFGLSDALLSDFRIGTTPLESYQGVTLEISGADGALTLFPGNVDSQPGGALTAAASWVARTSAVDATQLAVEIVGNLYKAGNGGIEALSAQIEIQFRKVGTATWNAFALQNVIVGYHASYWSAGYFQSVYQERVGYQTIWRQVAYGSVDPAQHANGDVYSPGAIWRYRNYAEIVRNNIFTGQPSLVEPAPPREIYGEVPTITISSGSTKPIRLTYRRTVERGQYEVRARRITPDTTDSTLISSLAWSQLRSYQPDDTDYTGQLRVALRIKASGQLQGTVDQLSAIASARTNAFFPQNPPTWSNIETSNPAWWFLDAARGRFINGRRVYGAGLPDSRIDLEGIKAFGVWCELKGLTFNFVFDAAISCQEMLEKIAVCGRASLSWATGKLGVVWDAPGLPVTAVFGMSNIRRRTFDVNYVTEKLADEIVVRFINPDLDWSYDTVRAKVPGVVTPVQPVEITIDGITNMDQAGREANLRAAAQFYRRRMITWETDFEGLPAARGDVIALSHDLTRWGYSGRLLGGTSTGVQLDRQVPFTPGKQHYIGIVFPNGFYAVLRVTFQTGPADTLTFLDTWPTVDDEGNTLHTASADPDHPAMDYRYQFDPKSTPGKRAKIVSWQPLSATTIRLVATDEDDAYYLQEGASYEYPTPATAGLLLPVISNVQITEDLLAAGSVFMVRLTLSWEVTGDFGSAKATISIDGAPPIEQVSFQRRIEFQVPDVGHASITLTLFDHRGRWGDLSRYTAEYDILGKSAPPPDVTEFTINNDVLDWKCPPVPDLAGYEIRFHQGINRSIEDATPLHRDVLIGAPYKLVDRPSGQVTLLIRAVDTSGNYSRNAAVIITDLGDPIVANVVEEFDLKVLGWPGTLTNATIDIGANLVADEVTLFYVDNDASAFYGLDSADFYPAALYTQMVYETDQIPFSDAGPGASLTLQQDIAGVNISVEWRRVGPGFFYPDADGEPLYSLDDAAPFYEPAPDYTAWPGFGAASNELYQWRVTIGGGATQGVISGLIATLDMPDVIERLNDIVIAPGGTRLPITKNFRAILNIGLTLQDDGGNATSVYIVDKNPVLGPLIAARDDTQTGTFGLIDAVIQGI